MLQKLAPLVIFLIALFSMTIFSGCQKRSEEIYSAPFNGEYGFTTNFQKPSTTDPKNLEKNKIFDGTIKFDTNGTFFISGTDTQQWPWRDKPQNRHEEERGTYEMKNGNILFSSPDIKEGGWSFSGEFKFFIFNSLDELVAKIGTKSIQYHLLQKPSITLEGSMEYIMLVNSYSAEKENL